MRQEEEIVFSIKPDETYPDRPGPTGQGRSFIPDLPSRHLDAFREEEWLFIRHCLEEKFLSEAEVTDHRKGFVVAYFINRERDPLAQLAAASLIVRHFQGVEHNKIIGIPMQGLPLASVIASRSNGAKEIVGVKNEPPRPYWKDVVRIETGSFTTEKRCTIHLPYIRKGDRILLIDDICAYGESALATIRAIREAGAEVVGFGTYFDKVFQGGLQRVEEEGVETFSVIRVKEFTPEDKIVLLRS